MLINQAPRDVYVGTAAWLTPLDLPKISDKEAPHPVLIDHLVVFDVDFQPFCYRRLEQARIATYDLMRWIEINEDLTLQSISYSGGKGFHLVFKDNDRSLFAIPDPRKREEAVREARRALLKRVVNEGFPVDTTVTADTRRIIRLPGSLHGTTGWACTRITAAQLAAPLRSWVKTIERHPDAQRLPRWPLRWPTVNGLFPGFRKRKTNKAHDQQEQPANTLTVMQCSTQVVGTNGRSAFMAWIPKRWSQGQIDAVGEKLLALEWGPIHRFEHLEQTLLISARAIPKEQLAKEAATMGWVNMANEIKEYGHAWIDLAPVTSEDASKTLKPSGLWEAAGTGGQRAPFSATHVEMLRRLGVEVDHAGHPMAGKGAPALRVVSKI